jgi:Zn-dependent protease with chaperone function
MTLPYLGRLICLCFAVFFLAQIAVAGIVAAFAGRALARAERMPARAGARLLFGLRLLPAAAAAFVVAALCAPSYLWLEPDATAEQVGWVCLAAAIFGMTVCAAGLARAGRAAIRSSRYLRNCQSAVESDAAVLMLAGVVRPRLVVSRGVRQTLTEEQLDAALRHERAHGVSRDNLKRLLMLLAPEPVPGFGALRRLEQGWSRMAEWAADDWAVEGSEERGLALASALLAVARMGRPIQTMPLATPLLADRDGLAERVERLLAGPAPSQPAKTAGPAIAFAVTAVAVLIPLALPAVHRALEALAH